MIALLWMLVACETEEETSWEQFNAPDESVAIEVGVDAELPLVDAVLTSSTGTVEIGLASVDPGGGPAGTEHLVVVQVFEDYKDAIDRVTVRTATEGRGEDEYDLEKDSAGEGYWADTLKTCCEGDEPRTDTLTFRLYEAVVVEDDEG